MPPGAVGTLVNVSEETALLPRLRVREASRG